MENLFRQEVINKRKHRLFGVISLVQPPIFKYLTYVLLSIVVISLCFLSLGSYTRKETVSGILQPNTGLLKINAQQSGIIEKLFIQEGEVVKQGQPLLRIESEKYGVHGFELNQSIIDQYTFQIRIIEQQQYQQKNNAKLEYLELLETRENLLQRQIQLDTQRKIFKKRVEINREIANQISSLADTGYISGLDLKKQQDNLLSLDQQSSKIDSEQLSIINEIDKIDIQLQKLPLNHERALNKLKTQLKQIQSQLLATKQKKSGELRAPTDGVITGLLVKTGKNVANHQKLLSIMPKNSKMQAIIYVPTSAFGFIEKGQITKLRYHAFPYQKFGIHEGIVTGVSSTVIFPEETEMPGLITVPSYRIIVDINAQSVQAYGRSIPLRSGMRLDADIVIERRSFLRWLFDPMFSISGKI